MSKQIIGIAGRLHSGKTSLADICVKHGYQKLYFALPLKKICAKFLKTDINGLNKLKNNYQKIDLIFDDSAVDFFSKETDIPKETVSLVLKGKKIENVRDLLQYIGTDLIRGYNMNWHINKIKELIEPNKKYVFDDLRFPNEKQLIDDLGGDNWFIVRPEINDVSHHTSEESLFWEDFGDKIIINNKSIEYLEMEWENFLENYDKSMELRERTIVDISLNGWDKWNHNYFMENCDEPFTLLDSLFISSYFFKYKKHIIDEKNIKSFEMNENHNLIIKHTDESISIISNPLNIEGIKVFI